MSYKRKRSSDFLPVGDSSLAFTVTSVDTNKRLDSYISEKTNLSRSKIQKFIQQGRVFVNERQVSQNYKVKYLDTITITIKEETPITLIAEPIPIDICYKDDFIVVVNKNAGMVVYPSFGHNKGTLINAIYYHCQKLAYIGMPLRPGIVHRLDKDTSGVMVIAIDDDAYYGLVKQFSERTINRRYLALISGNPLKNEGEIINPIGRSINDRKKMSVKTKKGKEALTKWKVIERYNGASLIETRLGTGRTHQIRVHLSSIGHPVLGDSLYGKKTFIQIGKLKIPLQRQMLHAETLGFTHPINNQYLEFSAPMPLDMKECIEKIKILI